MLKPLARKNTALALILGIAVGTPCVLTAANAAGVADTVAAADAVAWAFLETSIIALTAVLASWKVPATISGNPTIVAAMPRAAAIPCLSWLPDNVASVLIMKPAVPSPAAVAPTAAPTSIAVVDIPTAVAVAFMAALNVIVGVATVKPIAASGGANKAAAATRPNRIAAADIPVLVQNMASGLKPRELWFLAKSSSDRVCPVLPML